MTVKQFKMEYIDGIMIVDESGKILYSVRYNPRFGSEFKEAELNEVLGRNYLEIYPLLNPEESSITKCLKSGKPVYLPYQTFKDYNGCVIASQNFTFPIIRSGKTVGAVELVKDITILNDTIQEVEDLTPLNKKTEKFRNESKVSYTFDDIITNDSNMKMNIKKAKLASRSCSPVLIYGETGTGKEIFVQSIHHESARKYKPFIAQNCAAMPEGIFESLLFGSVKGAYTGAVDRKGLFEQADGGTLFLDEINSMSSNLQAKLLRVLQDGYIRKVGDDKDKKVDVRIIAAMNIEPHKAIQNGQLREDIFYRLSVLSLFLPALRERKSDLQSLVSYFINGYNERLNSKVEGITSSVRELFMAYSWPGNVRELEHIIEGAMHFVKDGQIDRIHLPVYLYNMPGVDYNSAEASEHQPSLSKSVELLEKKLIQESLKRSDWNISHAAVKLKIPRQTLRYKMKKYKIIRL